MGVTENAIARSTWTGTVGYRYRETAQSNTARNSGHGAIDCDMDAADEEEGERYNSRDT